MNRADGEGALGGAAEAVGRIPSGVSILTACDSDASTGMLASWVQQAAFEPLAVSVCVRLGRPILEMIEASGVFALNPVPEASGALFRHFGKGFGPGEDAFEGLEVERTAYGVRLTGALAYLGCRVINTVDVGDHRLIVGDVVEGRVMGDGSPHVHLRKTGASY